MYGHPPGRIAAVRSRFWAAAEEACQEPAELLIPTRAHTHTHTTTSSTSHACCYRLLLFLLLLFRLICSLSLPRTPLPSFIFLWYTVLYNLDCVARLVYPRTNRGRTSPLLFIPLSLSSSFPSHFPSPSTLPPCSVPGLVLVALVCTMLRTKSTRTR